MKKSVLAAAFALLSAFSVSAQRPGTKPLTEPRVRFGIGYRYSLGVAESYKTIFRGHTATSSWGTPDRMSGGELHFEGTVRVAPDWNVGAGAGLGMYDGDTFRSYRLYAKAEKLYGRQANRWFNYAEVGTTLYQNQSAGLAVAAGGGYRIAMRPRTRLDFTVGLDYLNVVGRADAFIDGQYVGSEKRGGRINRIGIAFGIAMHF